MVTRAPEVSLCVHTQPCMFSKHIRGQACIYTSNTRASAARYFRNVASRAHLPGLQSCCTTAWLPHPRKLLSFLICKMRRITVTTSCGMSEGSNQLLCTVSLVCNGHIVGALSIPGTATCSPLHVCTPMYIHTERCDDYTPVQMSIGTVCAQGQPSQLPRAGSGLCSSLNTPRASQGLCHQLGTKHTMHLHFCQLTWFRGVSI